jgi:hypothetical protein
MKRLHRRAALIRTRSYVVGFVVWLTLMALIALGGAITDQPADTIQPEQNAGAQRGN